MHRLVVFPGVAALVASAVLTPALASSPRQASPAPRFTVGLVADTGGVNDHGFNHMALQGMQAAGRQFHARGSFVVSRSSNDYVPYLSYFAKKGAGLTIGVGFLMESAMYQVARQYPNRKFALIDGAPTDAKGNTVNLKNVANLFFKEQESGYLVGVLAGLMEKNHVGKATHNTISYMGGSAIPPVNRYIYGYIAGARRVDPGVKILSGYSNSFTDQSKGKQIGLQHISQHSDILFQVAGASGLGYMAAAQERGVYAIGVDSDQGFLGSYVITSAEKRVDVAVSTIIHRAQTGTFHGGDYRFSLKNNGTGYAPPSRLVPRSIVAQVNHYRTLIASGKIVPPSTMP